MESLRSSCLQNYKKISIFEGVKGKILKKYLQKGIDHEDHPIYHNIFRIFGNQKTYLKTIETEEKFKVEIPLTKTTD